MNCRLGRVTTNGGSRATAPLVILGRHRLRRQGSGAFRVTPPELCGLVLDEGGEPDHPERCSPSVFCRHDHDDAAERSGLYA
jgi:hypothetical protein